MKKWWENVWFQRAPKTWLQNDGVTWQNGWFQKLMEPPGKWMVSKAMVSKVAHRHMKSEVKTSGFQKNGPAASDEKVG